MNTQKLTVRRSANIFLSVALAVLLTSCGSEKSPVTDLILSTYDQDGYTHAEVGVELNLGNTTLPTASIPIFDPRNPTVDYGELAVVGGFGVNEVKLDLNMTNILQQEPGDPTLPNGDKLNGDVIAGLGNSKLIEIPINGGVHKIYLAFGKGVAMIGFAVTVKEMDGIINRIGDRTYLLPGDIRGVQLLAGFFASNEPGKSGLAVFVNAGPVILPSDLIDLAGADQVRAEVYSGDYDDNQLYFQATSISKGDRKKFEKGLYKLHKRKTQLHLN